MNRRRISTKARLAFFAEQRGTCSLCAGRIDGTREAWDIEHTVPLALGGDDEPSNWTIVHRKCHLAKTRADVRGLAKARHNEARHTGAKASSSRPIPGSRASGIRKRMSGHVERW